MSKTKMRCNTCGKWFQSANAKDLTCPDCLQKARKEKLAAKSAPPTPAKSTIGQSTPPPPPKPKQTQSGTNQWLDAVNDVKVAQPDQTARPKLPPSPTPRDTRSSPAGYRDSGEPGNYREDRGPDNYREDRGSNIYREGGSRGPGGYRENENRTPGPYRVGGGSGLPNLGPRPRQPMEGGYGRGPRPGDDRPPRPGGPKDGKFGGKPKLKTPKPPPAPKPKREKIPPPEPFKPSAEQITQVETRYLELATPVEFDGIRTQIAHEVGIPKKVVKKIVKYLRDRQHIPSWWETQTFKGSEEDLAKIRAAYEPSLPIPDIGVHKRIAEQLGLKPGEVYQAIKSIRAEMKLPQYNDPAVHGLELKPPGSAQPDAQPDAQQDTQTQAQVPPDGEPAPIPTDAVDTTDTAALVNAKQEEQQSEGATNGDVVESDKSVTSEA